MKKMHSINKDKLLIWSPDIIFIIDQIIFYIFLLCIPL